NSAIAELTTGALAGLTPAQSVAAAVETFQRKLELVRGGNTGEIGNLAQAGTAAVQAAQQAYGNAPRPARIRERITAELKGFLGLRVNAARAKPALSPEAVNALHEILERNRGKGTARELARKLAQRRLTDLPRRVAEPLISEALGRGRHRPKSP